jgi:aromatic-L-amino-acid/L-tryptophan decarboxylase
MSKEMPDLFVPAGTLDPENWDELRALGHEMLDDMIDYLRNVRERPAWQSPSQEARSALRRPLPRTGNDLAEVYRTFKQHILPYPTGNIHPRFWGWVMGGGTPVGMLADLLGSAMNCHVSGYDQSAALVEHQVIRWLAEMFDYPEDASGVLVDGGTVANILGVTVARNTTARFDVRNDGVSQETNPLTIYGSVGTHGWAKRSCDLLGLGEKAFRAIATDSRDRVDVEAMRAAIAADRARNCKPFCVVGSAGTVATGATDNLHALADLAREEHLWFHIDGAFGALAKLSPKYRYIVDGMERADSIAFDLHKWGYMQYETGAVLIRDAKAHKEAFSFGPSYLETFRAGIAIEPTEFASRGIQLSRGFRALRVWMNLLVYGTERLGAMIEQNIEDAQYLRQRIEADANLELLGPAEMNVVCFRYRPVGKSEAELDALNRELLVRIQESGIAVPSNARIAGHFAIRVAHTNHRTVRSDFDRLLEVVLTIGASILADGLGTCDSRIPKRREIEK